MNNKNLYFFETKTDNYYLFNSYQQRISKLPLSLYRNLLSNNFSSELLFGNQKSFYERISDVTIPNTIVKTVSPYVNVTLANSNICNLNCSYCHRNKQHQEEINIDKLEEIIDYVINIFSPNSKGYVIDYDLQGEPLRDPQNLKKFEYLKMKYESILSAKNKWIFFSFITNRTFISKEIAKKIKDLGICKQTVSIDGPEYIHDSFRKYSNGKGSHKDVIRGIRELQQNNIRVHASCVLTAKFPCLSEILNYFLSIKIDTVHFQLVRSPAPYCFDDKTLNILLEDIKTIYERLFIDISNNDFSLLNLLKDSLIFSPIKNLLLNNKYISRCNWNQKIIIDTKGDIYPCLGLIGNLNYCYGNIRDKPLSDLKFGFQNTVDQNTTCKECWARYLCGGHCKLISINEFNNMEKVSAIECKFRKELIKYSLVLFTKLMELDLLDRIILPLCKDDLCDIINK